MDLDASLATIFEILADERLPFILENRYPIPKLEVLPILTEKKKRVLCVCWHYLFTSLFFFFFLNFVFNFFLFHVFPLRKSAFHVLKTRIWEEEPSFTMMTPKMFFERNKVFNYSIFGWICFYRIRIPRPCTRTIVMMFVGELTSYRNHRRIVGVSGTWFERTAYTYWEYVFSIVSLKLSKCRV